MMKSFEHHFWGSAKLLFFLFFLPLSASAQSPINFSNIYGGKPTLDSVQIFRSLNIPDTLVNFGDYPFEITSIKISGPDSLDFSFGGVALPDYLFEPHTKLACWVVLSPIAHGLRTATISIEASYDTIRQDIKILVQVFGLTPCTRFSTLELFKDSNVTIGDSLTECINVINCGEVPTIYAALTNDTAVYSVQPLASAIIRPGDSTQFCVTFRPHKAGHFDAVLIIEAPNAGGDVTLRGNGVSNSVEGENKNDGFLIDPIFPNPASRIVTLNFFVPRESVIDLSLSNMAGEFMRRIVNGIVSQGQHKISFDISDFPSGNYIISLESGNTRVTKEMIVLK